WRTPPRCRSGPQGRGDYQAFPHRLCDICRIIKRHLEDHLQHTEGLKAASGCQGRPYAAGAKRSYRCNNQANIKPGPGLEGLWEGTRRSGGLPMKSLSVAISTVAMLACLASSPVAS